MGFFRTIGTLFWNKNEKRVRALWRIGIHTGLVLIFTSAFTVVLLLFFIIIGLVTGANLGEIISISDPMQIMYTPWVGTVIIPAASFLGVLLTTFMAGRWVDRRKIKEFGIVFSKGWWVDFSFGLSLGAVLMGLIFLVGWGTRNVQVTGFFKSFIENSSFISGFIQALIFFVFVGIYEEVLSRGYHLINLAEGFNGKMIDKRWALMIAFIISSLIFGLLHMGNPNATWISTLNISLAGMFLGLGMVLTGSLAIPIGLHITWNFFQGNVFGFPVSGVNTGATIIATESVGKQWVTGGLFGPEAGLLGLAAILLGSILTIVWVRRKGFLALQTDLAVYEPQQETTSKS